MMAPILLAHPLAAAIDPNTWDAQQGVAGWLQYGVLCVMTIAQCAASIASSYDGLAAHRQADALRSKLSLQARFDGEDPAYLRNALHCRAPPLPRAQCRPRAARRF